MPDKLPSAAALPPRERRRRFEWLGLGLGWRSGSVGAALVADGRLKDGAAEAVLADGSVKAGSATGGADAGGWTTAILTGGCAIDAGRGAAGPRLGYVGVGAQADRRTGVGTGWT